jgi:chloramphenicol 3-O-phosphotransferase
MAEIGRCIAYRALSERRNVVTEIIGAEFGPTTQLIDSLRSLRYTVRIVGVTCDVGEAYARNLNRGEDNISAYYAEPFQRQWLIEAAHRIESEKAASDR